MIQTFLANEPSWFNITVRQKGLNALKTQGFYNNAFWKKHNYWKQAHKALYKEYGGICAYLGIQIFCKQTNNVIKSSVEHFKPKSKYPHNAYDWDNYLLASAQVNSMRENNEDILNPFLTPDGIFHLRLNSGIIYVDNGISKQLQSQAVAMIKNIKLNNPIFCNLRKKIYEQYLSTPDILLQRAPFIWLEACIQGKIVL